MSQAKPTLTLIRSDEVSAEEPEDVDVSIDDFDAFFAHWSPYVAGIGVNILGDPSAVDDLVQDVFIKVLENRDKIRDPSAIKSWLTTVAVRLCYRKLKKRKVLVFLGIEAPPRFEKAVSEAAPQEHRVLLTRVLKSLENVQTVDRVAWSVRYLQGESLKDTATYCACSLATVKRRIARAQAHLEEEFGDEN